MLSNEGNMLLKATNKTHASRVVHVRRGLEGTRFAGKREHYLVFPVVDHSHWAHDQRRPDPVRRVWS